MGQGMPAAGPASSDERIREAWGARQRAGGGGPEAGGTLPLTSGCPSGRPPVPTMGFVMARRCQVTGAVGRSGNNISHSHRRTKRRFEINVQTKRYFIPSEQRHVTLTVSAKGIKTIDRRGIEAVVKELRARGEKV